jgi:hypothetical protein
MRLRDDVRGVERAPQEIEDYLLTIGGRTPFDEPMWRLVLARNVIWKVAGGKVWDEGLTVSERGGFVDDGFNDQGLGLRMSEARPLRDESGRLVEQQRYPHLAGWILQRWFPPGSYNKSQWFAPENCMAGGTPKLGPFPQYGDYEIVGGPVEKVPDRQKLYDFVSAYYRGLETRSGSVESRVREAVNAAEYARQREEQKTRTFVEEYMRDKCSYIWSSSLEAGRVREEVGRRAGIREHVGN